MFSERQMSKTGSMFDGGLIQTSMEANTESVDIKVHTMKEDKVCEIDSEDEMVNKEDTEDPEEERKYFSGKGESEDGETGVKNIIQDSELEIKKQNKVETENDEKTEEVNQGQRRDSEEREEKRQDFEDQTIKDVNAKINREEGSHIIEGIKTPRETDAEEVKDRERQQDTTNAKPVAQLLAPISAEPKSRDRLSPQDVQKQIRRLTPDFPDSLYELLCSLQEGRRLNDQRCSFIMERRCHSEPSTPVPRHRVVFSSMTSLQKEEFFEFVATSQGRRLDDQRAELHDVPAPQPPLQPKASDRKTSLKGAEARRVAPRPAPKEELYNMILTSQAQGRLEEQRSPAPGPMDDEDFFSLLLRVQGGRIDEQRTELPITLRD
ncbi:G-protein-signaling modulator 2 [Conger conger]|uniref:G-protein-signaling modulator 2 n=1 Tax=Conger conger TaxID=82655 RepID=UPI002A59DEAC|nr:G-protein-signaling modulator 2 [Conger conger]